MERKDSGMEPYAVVETGGKQYRVQVDDVLSVERLGAEPGERVALEPVLAISDGKALRIGTPDVAGAKVTVSVKEHIRGVKLISFKKKRRKTFKKKKGHRQDLTVVRVEAIG
jgi:large subunit ribosomal protein L21